MICEVALDKKVSVVIPVYNSSKYISCAIDSVLSQDYTNFEIIVVDDGSTDNTCSVIESKYLGKVKIIKIKNSGVSVARNIGINSSNGYYIAFLDSDDFWEKSKLAKQVKSIEKDIENGVSYTSRFIIKNENIITGEERKSWSGFVLNKILIKNFICLSSVLIKKECFLKCGFFDEALEVSEDYDLWIRISNKYKFVYLDERLVYYRVTPGSLTKNVTRMIINAHKVFLQNTLDDDISNKVKFLTYIYFYSDTFKTTGHYFYDINNYKAAKNLFFLSFLLWPFRLETLKMLVRSFLKKNRN